jgi:hypothetical protein
MIIAFALPSHQWCTIGDIEDDDDDAMREWESERVRGSSEVICKKPRSGADLEFSEVQTSKYTVLLCWGGGGGGGGD